MSVTTTVTCDSCGIKSHETIDTLIEQQNWHIIKIAEVPVSSSSNIKSHRYVGTSFHACPKCHRTFENRVVDWLFNYPIRGKCNE